jgi:hypothetical protein
MIEEPGHLFHALSGVSPELGRAMPKNVEPRGLKTSFRQIPTKPTVKAGAA